MKKIAILLLAVVFALAACAPRVWYRPGATSSRRDADLRACRYEGEQLFSQQTPPLTAFRVYVDVPWGTPGELALRVRQAADDAVREAYEDYQREFLSGFVHDCMKRKGYVLVKQE